jgi:hypothetical protein
MARTLTEIYDALALEKSEMPELTALQPNIDTAQSLLNSLATPSRVARWRLMLWVVAVCTFVHENLWDLFRAEVDAIALGSTIGTLRWYVNKALAYQHGYDLVIIDNVPKYELDVPAARIVKSAAGRDVTGHVIIKVAKVVSGNLAPLSTPEFEGFEAYMDAIKMAGTVLTVLSAPPDQVRVTATVYYNPLLLAANGSLLTDGSVFPAEDAIREYFSSLPFNGEMSITALQDALQRVPSIVNPVISSVQTQYGAFPFTPVVQYYTAYAGYLIIDPLTPLATTITYVPYAL